MAEQSKAAGDRCQIDQQGTHGMPTRFGGFLTPEQTEK